MPVQRCQKDGKPGYAFGSEGFCYTYIPGNEPSRKRAKQKAILQGAAIGEDDKTPDPAFLEAFQAALDAE